MTCAWRLGIAAATVAWRRMPSAPLTHSMFGQAVDCCTHGCLHACNFTQGKSTGRSRGMRRRRARTLTRGAHALRRPSDTPSDTPCPAPQRSAAGAAGAGGARPAGRRRRRRRGHRRAAAAACAACAAGRWGCCGSRARRQRTAATRAPCSAVFFVKRATGGRASRHAQRPLALPTHGTAPCPVCLLSGDNAPVHLPACPPAHPTHLSTSAKA